MKNIYLSLCGLALIVSNANAANFATSVKEVRAILDVPVLSSLLNNGAVEGIQKVAGSIDIFEVSSTFCKAKIRIISDPSGVQNPKAESLGAECGP